MPLEVIVSLIPWVVIIAVVIFITIKITDSSSSQKENRRVNIAEDENNCPLCGGEIKNSDKFCTECGVELNRVTKEVLESKVDLREETISKKERLPTLLLCIFLGTLGAHRFYVGKIGTGVLWLLTLGLLGIGTLVDLVMIIIGSFKDKDGKVIEKWTINWNLLKLFQTQDQLSYITYYLKKIDVKLIISLFI